MSEAQSCANLMRRYGLKYPPDSIQRGCFAAACSELERITALEQQLEAALKDAAVPDGFALVPVEPTAEIISAMLCSEAVDDEGAFPALLDLIGYSGENKTRIVMRAAYKALIAVTNAGVKP